ncbi:hypothetical protein SPRG_12272 [Saprolegnia parasitica CBS 223.65]|uniref:MalT-like TPR region domain-containing protein n=1 Tax=Saprolegnia parasitica (strain CBS 223.65) TaxID=695850 RepID=A0A067BWJ0_SAPPC|nr:hypothetical protein SPRG_12272 [Saprolegnia parasitica CBS 223.65]KDO22643.1 hypothetical protein SPRG_12272 [Saprolegnia parasitica CBS 223.65]|eukprot:XP_012206651.1 hypothetical protein SPRG_12272 [Saprolegnia parasitica CBS 223.65]
MPSPDRGVRLSYLRHFINSHGGESSFAGKTTAQVCFEFVVPMTKPTELSLVDHVANDPTTADYVSPANWYVSHAWQYLFLETVDSLERFFADRGLADDAVIWFCVFNNNQHLASSYPFEYWSTTFKNGLAAIGNVVMIMHPWNDPIVLRRSWCVFEVYVAVTMGARFEIALARDQEATENSEATVPSDRDGIFGLIRAETSFIAVDRLIFSTLSSWIKTALEASIASTPTPVAKAARWLQLGIIYQNEVDHAEGERCFRRAVALFAEYRGPFDYDTLQTQATLAYAIAYQRKPRREWEPLSLSTIRDATEHLGATHNVTLHARSSYALALSWNNDDVAALAVHMDLYDIWRHQYGIRDWHTAGTMNKIGMCHFKLGALRVAARWLQKSLPVLEAHFGVDHSETTQTTSYLAGAFTYSGQQLKALPLQQRLVETSERILGADNPDTIVHKMNAAILHIMAGQTRDAAAQLLPLERSLASRATQSQQLADQLRDGTVY